MLAMPILAPLADTVGIDHSIVVSAYNWGQYAICLAPTGLVSNPDHARHEVLPLGEVHSPDGLDSCSCSVAPYSLSRLWLAPNLRYILIARGNSTARRVAIRPAATGRLKRPFPWAASFFGKGIAAVFPGIRLGFTAVCFRSFQDCPS